LRKFEIFWVDKGGSGVAAENRQLLDLDPPSSENLAPLLTESQLVILFRVKGPVTR